MGGASYLFDNQYHPEVVDRAYHNVLRRSWDHCMRIQRDMCQKRVYGGPLTDFKLDEKLNRDRGFPTGSYTYFMPVKLIDGDQRYVLEHFVKNKEVVTIREMLSNPKFKFQYLCQLAEFLFMGLKIQLAQNGTWLIVPIDTPDGISSVQWEDMRNNYGAEPYVQNRWILERRPKVSYGYVEGALETLLSGGNRIYLSDLTEWADYLTGDYVNDWKVAVSVYPDHLNLLRMGFGTIGTDEDGDRYIEITGTFSDYIRSMTETAHILVFNEPNKAGFTVSPNYIGPSTFITTNDEDVYLAASNLRRFRVLAENGDGGTTKISGYDRDFGEVENLCNVGFTQDQCWVSLPMKDDTPPIYPGNFRVWEYDVETDSLLRMVAYDMELRFPNVYLYKMFSEQKFLYIEWFRDEATGGLSFDDMTEQYRSYIGDDFGIRLMRNELAPIVETFEPLHAVYDTEDFMQHVLMTCSPEYRIDSVSKLLNDDGSQWRLFQDAIDQKNCPYSSWTTRLYEDLDLYWSLVNQDGDQLKMKIAGVNRLCPYLLYVDGILVGETQGFWEEFDQIITIPRRLVTPASTIVVDLFPPDDQINVELIADGDFTSAIMPANYPIPEVSGRDLVVTALNGARFPRDKVQFAIFAKRYAVQIPENFVDWEKLGIDIDDPRLAKRIGTDSTQPNFRSVVFEFITNTDASYAELNTVSGETIVDVNRRVLMIKDGDVVVSTEADGEEVQATDFSKKVRSADIAVRVVDYSDESGYIKVWNATVFRRSTVSTLSSNPKVRIQSFCGASEPNRFVAFIDGKLCGSDNISGNIPASVGRDLEVTFRSGSYGSGQKGEVVYLPFPVDRFEVVSDSTGHLNLAGSGIDCLTSCDMVFENGKRVDNRSLKHVTNQIVKVPTAGATYTIIRNHRDSNMYSFNDVELQSFLDKLFQQDPAFRTYYESNM